MPQAVLAPLQRIRSEAQTALDFIVAAALALSVPARFQAFTQSLWLDEAWVANSLLAPSLAEMFRYYAWVQTSPPLFLLLERLVVGVAGPGEWAFRVVPWLGSFLAPVVLWLLLKRLFSGPVALLSVTLVIANYWAIKLAQQAKQYGTDLLAASVFVYAIARFCTSGGDRRAFRLLAVTGCLAPFLSFASVFWLPPAVLAVALDDFARPVRRLRWLAMGMLLGLFSAVNYFVFIRPNYTGDLVFDWDGYFLEMGRFWPTLGRFVETIADLLVLQALPFGALAAAIILLFVVAGALRSMRESVRGDARAVTAVLACLLPVAAGMIASFAHRYPLLGFTRMVIWVLPCCVFLFAYGLEPFMNALQRKIGNGPLLRYGVPAVCLAGAMATQVVLFSNPRPSESNREAVAFLQSNAKPGDCVFIHGGMSEQFVYYRRMLGWAPGCVYLGNTDWPCCFRNKEARTSSNDVEDFNEDLRRAAKQAASGRLFLLMPPGERGHWSLRIQSLIEEFPAVMAKAGCRQELMRQFDQTRVWAFDCR